MKGLLSLFITTPRLADHLDRKAVLYHTFKDDVFAYMEECTQVTGAPGISHGEILGMMIGVKPALAGLNYRPDYLQYVLNSIGIRTLYSNGLLIQPDLLKNRMDREPRLASACKMSSPHDLKDLLEAYKKSVVDTHITHADQLGFVLGFPGSAIRGRKHFDHIVKKYEHPRFLSTPPFTILLNGIFHVDPNLQGKAKHQVSQLASNWPTHLRRLPVERTWPRGLRVAQENARSNLFCILQSEAISELYRELGVEPDDARFLAQRREVAITTPEQNDCVFHFVTWDSPTPYNGSEAPDLKQLEERVDQACQNSGIIW